MEEGIHHKILDLVRISFFYHSYNVNSKNYGPKLTMGSKNKGSGQEQYAPGPGMYDPNLNSTLKQTSGCTLGCKYTSVQNIHQAPGPGAYNMNLEGNLQVGGKIGTSKRSNLGANGGNPGPASYNAQSRPYSAGPKYKFGKEVKSTFLGNNDPGRTLLLNYSWTI